MIIEIESTEKVVSLNGTPARIWEGKTKSGIPVHCFVTRISPQTNDKDLYGEFEDELKETRPPSPAIQAYPLSMIL